MRTVVLFALSVLGVSAGRRVGLQVDVADMDAVNAAVQEELDLEDADFTVNAAVEAFEDMSLDVDESGVPGCCYRDCCVGRPRRRNRCIRRANMCHRRGGYNAYNNHRVVHHYQGGYNNGYQYNNGYNSGVTIGF